MNELTDLYTKQVGINHRKQVGQFFTPQEIAQIMVNWIMESNPKTILDPAFGLGVFGQEVHKKNETLLVNGVEIDSVIGDFVRENLDLQNTNLEIGNYLQKWFTNVPAIICNPPYFKFQNIKNREVIFNSFRKYTGVNVSGYTNIASLFLLKSIYELAPSGRLAYIMPLEFLNTGYGEEIKAYMLQQGSIHSIIKIECEKDIFPEVTTTVCILLFEKNKKNNNVVFSKILDTHTPPTFIKKLPENELKPENKWGVHFYDNMDICSKNLIFLSEYGFFSRGIATGANEFFVLNQKKINLLGLQESEYLPCITKSTQVEQGTFEDRNFEKLVENGKSVFLLNIDQKHPSAGALRYIENGKDNEFHLRYLTRTRKPWYKIEHRNPAPIWFGVFSRGGYKVIRNFSKVLNLTCFHGFQPNLFGLPFVDHLFLYFMSSTGRKLMTLNKRVYGEQLDKFEPGDLNGVLVPNSSFFASISSDFISKEIDCVRKTGSISVEAENLFANLINNS